MSYFHFLISGSVKSVYMTGLCIQELTPMKYIRMHSYIWMVVWNMAFIFPYLGNI